MREYFTPQRSVFPSYLTVESGRMNKVSLFVNAFLHLQVLSSKKFSYLTESYMSSSMAMNFGNI